MSLCEQDFPPLSLHEVSKMYEFIIAMVNEFFFFLLLANAVFSLSCSENLNYLYTRNTFRQYAKINNYFMSWELF